MPLRSPRRFKVRAVKADTAIRTSQTRSLFDRKGGRFTGILSGFV
jgi:hypothetical protein